MRHKNKTGEGTLVDFGQTNSNQKYSISWALLFLGAAQIYDGKLSQCEE